MQAARPTGVRNLHGDPIRVLSLLRVLCLQEVRCNHIKYPSTAIFNCSLLLQGVINLLAGTSDKSDVPGLDLSAVTAEFRVSAASDLRGRAAWD